MIARPPRFSRRALLAAAVAGGATLVGAADKRNPASGPPPRLSEEAFRALAERVSNWGRWGKGDVLGSLNTITPTTIRRAAELVRTGETVHCGGPIPSLLPGTADRTGNLTLRIDAADDWGAVNDRVTIDVHGHLGLTHLDALAHIYYRGHHYNGQPFAGILGDRVPAFGIETAGHGITGRGILVDLPAAVGKPWLDPADRLTPADLRRAIAATGETLGPGDILVFNTGFEALQRSRGTAPGAGVPTGGLQIECAELLHASQPALIISDLGMDTWPSEVENVQIPWHVLCIVMMGVRLVDCAHVEGLLEVTRRLRRSTFLCVVSPVEYPGATSSPVNPICVF